MHLSFDLCKLWPWIRSVSVVVFLFFTLSRFTLMRQVESPHTPFNILYNRLAKGTLSI